jgi:hypothetical protein
VGNDKTVRNSGGQLVSPPLAWLEASKIISLTET